MYSSVLCGSAHARAYCRKQAKPALGMCVCAQCCGLDSCSARLIRRPLRLIPFDPAVLVVLHSDPTSVHSVDAMRTASSATSSSRAYGEGVALVALDWSAMAARTAGTVGGGAGGERGVRGAK